MPWGLNGLNRGVIAANQHNPRYTWSEIWRMRSFSGNLRCQPLDRLTYKAPDCSGALLCATADFVRNDKQRDWEVRGVAHALRG